MMNHIKQSNLILTTVLLLLSAGCDKNDIDRLIRKDFRNRYPGTWAFSEYTSEWNMLMGTIYDTSFYYGEITLGPGEDELTINSVVRKVQSDGIISFTGSGWNTSSGNFEGDNKIYLYTMTGSNSRQTRKKFYGEKQIKSSILDLPPSVATTPAVILLSEGATLNGTLKASLLFTKVSFDYGLTADYGNSKTAPPNTFFGNSDMTVSTTISGLTPGTQYHFRIKASNSKGTSYGTDMTFTTVKTSAPFTDIDGNIYKTITIGKQVWMAENLRVTRSADGTALQLISDQDSWNSISESAKAFCYYKDDPGNAKTYGALYKWTAAMNGAAGSSATPSGVQGVCPSGWHLPSEGDWNILESYLGGASAGVKMLAVEEGGTNESGFSAIKVGRRSTYPYTFLEFGGRAYFWTTTLYSINYGAIYVRMVTTGFNNPFLYKTDGLSVRCVKN